VTLLFGRSQVEFKPEEWTKKGNLKFWQLLKRKLRNSNPNVTPACIRPHLDFLIKHPARISALFAIHTTAPKNELGVSAATY